MTLRAGAAILDITPPVGVLMDGYGGRSQGSLGVLDPLFARVLVLDDGENACAIVGCDLLGMHPQITSSIRKQVAAATSIPPEAILIAATHNHAGPYGLRSGLFGTLNEELAAHLVSKVSSAVIEAYEGRRPAALKSGSAHLDTVSQNRRDPEWPIDPLLRILVLDGEDGPIANLINFACHATVMTGENLMLSAEFPGQACALVQRETGAPAVYLNGACGDVNPVWVRQDYENVKRVGRIIGGQALRTIGELRTLGHGQRAHNIRWDEFTEKPSPGRIIEPRIRSALLEVDVPLRTFRNDSEYSSWIAPLQSRADALAAGSDQRRDVMAQLTRAQSERWAAAWSRRQPAGASHRTEVQAISLGSGLAISALPGEFFVETGAAIRSSFDGDLIVACYANDYVGYVVPEDAYEQGGYEPGVTFCAQGAEAAIRDAAVDLLREVANAE